MNNVTRNDVWELAKSRRNDLVKLASDLIRIPSENPVGTQRDVIDFVENKWSKDEKWSYAIWGENDASERLYNYLSSNYPNAIFTAFYDSYKKVNYHGIDAQHPNKIDPQDHVFVFVTGYTATDAANELFHKIGLPEDSYYLFGSVVRDYK